MPNAYDIAYATALGVSAPFWLALPKARRKVLDVLRRQRSATVPPRAGDGPTVLIHAVSLGEINATRAMVRLLAERHPALRFVVSTTSHTGYARGQELYGRDPRVTLVRYPFDFSRMVARVLDGMRPDAVVLMELEVWPNFVLGCARRSIPVMVVNGRLTAGSYRNYRLGALLLRRTFGRLAAVCAQEQTYADRFVSLGVPTGRVQVTGTMKFDNAQVAERIEGDRALAEAVGLRPGDEPILVCGSTGPGEERVILDAWRAMRSRVRLVLVPRKPERFDEVAHLVRAAGLPLVRRSAPPQGSLSGDAVILGDTMGELRTFYSLADVVVVGRTLVDLGPRQHGSDMIEPAALGKPVIVGPYTGNFAEVMNCFRIADAMREIGNASELGPAIERVLADRDGARQMGRRAQGVVARAQGATSRNVEIILRQLPGAAGPIPAAQPSSVASRWA